MKNEREQIQEALRRQDRAVIEHLYRLFGQKIYGYCYRLCGHVTDAEDLTADVFLNVIQSSNDLKNHEAIITWLYRIAHRCCSMRFREQKRLIDLPDDLCGREDLPEKIALRLTLLDAISKLPARYREVLKLCDIDERSYEEVAERLHISVHAVNMRLHYARRQLRELIIAEL